MKSEGFFYDKLQFAGLVGKGVMLTKDGYLFSTFKVRPHDLAFEDIINQQLYISKLNNVFRFLIDGWVLYSDVIRSKVKIDKFDFDENAPENATNFDNHRDSLLEFYQNEFYLTFMFTNEDIESGSGFLFSKDKEESKNLTDNLFYFEDMITKIQSQLTGSFQEVHYLDDSQLLTYLHSLFSDNHKINVPQIPFFLDVYLADRVFQAKNVVTLDDEVLISASIMDFPTESKAGMFTDLFDCPHSFRYSVRCEFMSKKESKKSISSIRTSYMKKRKGAMNTFLEAITKDATTTEDPEAVLLSEEAIEAEGLLADGQTAFAYVSTAIIVRDKDFGIATSTLKSLTDIVEEHGFICKREIFNNPLIFLGSLPGNVLHNKRKYIISSHNIAHLLCLSDVWRGDYENDFFGDLSQNNSPLVITRTSNNPFFLNLNIKDIGHSLCIGPTGAGKSIFINVLATQAFRYHNARVIFFDKDKSSEPSCLNLGGSFFDLFADDSSFRLNPFSNIGNKNTAEEKQRSTDKIYWLTDFFCDFFRAEDLPVGGEEKNEILTALISLASHKEHACFLDFQNALQEPLFRASLEPYVNGIYSSLFFDGDDSLTFNRFIAFEMNHLMGMSGNVISFVLEYLFFQIEYLFDGINPFFLILDECWLFLGNSSFSAKLKDWLKTLRKKKVFVIMATQELEDSRSSPIFSTIVNACLTKILLPNPAADQAINKESYYDMGLTDVHLEVIKNAELQRDYLYYSPKGCQLFSLDLDDRQIEHLTKIKGVR